MAVSAILVSLVFLSAVVAANYQIDLREDKYSGRALPGPAPLPKYPAGSLSPSTVADGQIDVIGTMQSRLGTMYTDMANACCSNKAQCSNSGNYCTRSCPASCWITGWSTAPTVTIGSFTLDSNSPSSYTPTLIVPQNYTNYAKNSTTSATFNYSQQFTDTVTVENSQTLTTSLTVETKVEIKIVSVDATVGFSYSTTQDTSVTNTTTKTWGITFGPTPVPPCSGIYLECYILAANYNPTFTAVYVVDGTPTDECNGNWYWDAWAMQTDAQYYMCIDCTPEYCPSPHITFDNTITVTGTWNGVIGAQVICDSKPYDLPPHQCS